MPHLVGSGLIDQFRAHVEPTVNGFKVIAGWQGDMPQLKFLQDGTRNMPARPIVGIRPQTLALIGTAVFDEAARIAADFGYASAFDDASYLGV